MTTETNVNIDASRLNSLIARIERLQEQKKALAEDIKEVYAEAKSAGFEIKPLKAIIKLKEISSNQQLKNKHDEEQYWFDTYKTALNID